MEFRFKDGKRERQGEQRGIQIKEWDRKEQKESESETWAGRD